MGNICICQEKMRILQLKTDNGHSSALQQHYQQKEISLEMEQTEFHHKLQIQLRFTDADQFGHINNTAYFQYYDTAKIDYVRKVCNIPKGNHAIFAVHVEADFLAQVHSTDRVEVQTAITEIGTKSFTLIQRLVDIDTQEVKCIGRTVMVAFDLERNESVPMLPEWIDAICKFEGRDVRRKP